MASMYPAWDPRCQLGQRFNAGQWRVHRGAASAATWAASWSSQWWQAAGQLGAAADVTNSDADMSLYGLLMIVALSVIVTLCIIGICILLCWYLLRSVVHQEIRLSCEKAMASLGNDVSRPEATELRGRHAATGPTQMIEAVGNVGELRNRHEPLLQCYYVQGGKKLHVDMSCCDMSRPKEVMIPVAASPFVAWCHRCAPERAHWKGS